jgi:MSHA biogenesis protein MshJ
MKTWLEMLASRIDALSLRERAIIFSTALIVLLLVADTLWLSPAQIQQSQAAASVRQQSAELQSLREQLRAGMMASTAASPVQLARSELKVVQSRLEAVNRDIAFLSLSSGETDPLSKVLVQFLRRHDGLTLERTATLAPDVGAAKPVRDGAAAPAVARQGVELTVSGSYLELTRYVQTLERALPTLRWGVMTLTSGKTGSWLTLQVYLVGEPQ